MKCLYKRRTKTIRVKNAMIFEKTIAHVDVLLLLPLFFGGFVLILHNSFICLMRWMLQSNLNIWLLARGWVYVCAENRNQVRQTFIIAQANKRTAWNEYIEMCISAHICGYLVNVACITQYIHNDDSICVWQWINDKVTWKWQQQNKSDLNA